MMRTLVQWALLGLLPPERPDEMDTTAMRLYRAAMVRWKHFIALLCWMLLCTGAVFASWSLGMMPWDSGFARAGDMQESREAIEQQLKILASGSRRMEQRQLGMVLMETRRLQCKALTSDNSELRLAYAREMDRLQFEHDSLTGYRWASPACSEL